MPSATVSNVIAEALGRLLSDLELDEASDIADVLRGSPLLSRPSQRT